MKRYLILILVILVLTLAGIVGCGQKSSSTEIYHNSKYGYSLEIPKTWTINEEKNRQTITFRSPHNQMEIVVNVDSEDALNDFYSEFVARAGDTAMTPLELLARASATEDEKLGAKVKYIEWNENAMTTFTLIETEDFQSWVKTYYIIDKGNFYLIAFKVIGYSDSEFNEYRNKLNEICKGFCIDDSSVINLPEGKTVFDF